MIETAEWMLSNVWFVFNSLQPLLTFLIGLGTLIAVIYGFSRYNDHSRKLEAINIYKMMKDQFDKYHMNAHVNKFQIQCSEIFKERVQRYLSEIGNTQDNKVIQKAESINTKDKDEYNLSMLLDVIMQIMIDFSSIRQFIKDFDIDSIDKEQKYYSIFIKDLLNIDSEIQWWIGEIEKLNKKVQTRSTMYYLFANKRISASLINNYKELSVKCHQYVCLVDTE